MLQVFQRLVVGLFLSLLLAVTASAQEAETGDLTAAIKGAAEAGISVVVIDSNGQLLSGDASSAEQTGPENEAMEGMSALMKRQAEVNEFRDAFWSRVEALP